MGSCCAVCKGRNTTLPVDCTVSTLLTSKRMHTLLIPTSPSFETRCSPQRANRVPLLQISRSGLYRRRKGERRVKESVTVERVGKRSDVQIDA